MHKSRKIKNSIKEVRTHNQQRPKYTRNSATRTPKHYQTINDRKSPQLSKFKSLPIKNQRQTTCSILPPQIQHVDKQNQFVYKAYKTNKTNSSALDIPYSHSQKTITLQKTDMNSRVNHRADRTSKKHKDRKSKYDQQTKVDRGAVTSRKSSAKKLTLDVLLRKTQRVLKNYQKKEEQWVKQRQTLLEEIQELKRKKNQGRTLTSSTSTYINKRQFY